MSSTLAGLRDVAPGVVMDDAGRPEPGLQSVAAIAGLVPSWLDELTPRMGRRDVATSFCGMWLAGPVAALVTATVLVRDRSLLLTPETVWMGRSPGGWIDRVTVEPAFVSELPTEELLEHAASRLVAVASPLLAALADAGRFGLRGLWGNSVADRVMETATSLVRAGLVLPPALALASSLLDAVARLAPVSLPRPLVQVVAHRGAPSVFAVKSCCCLMYKTMPVAPGDVRSPEAYCTSCPLISDSLRPSRWRAHLDSV